MISRASILLFAFAILLVGCKHIYTTPETFAEAIFNAFQQDNYKDYELQFCTAADYDRLLEITVMEDDHRTEVVARKDKDLAALRGDIQGGWETIRTEGEKAGVEWKSAKFDRVHYTMGERLGVPHTNIYIVFSSNGKSYEFKLDDCVKTDIRWFVTDNPIWTGELMETEVDD
jgi:hypothetical protein